jgi:hypothetical protein
MDYEKYSKQKFEERGLDTPEAGKLAEELQNDVAEEMHKAVSAAFLKIIDKLNAQGHNLESYGEISIGDLPFRDVADDGIYYLRLGCDVVISTGYANVIPPNPKRK